MLPGKNKSIKSDTSYSTWGPGDDADGLGLDGRFYKRPNRFIVVIALVASKNS
jgi:hypothetical protein